jgi:hypothetical protein
VLIAMDRLFDIENADDFQNFTLEHPFVIVFFWTSDSEPCIALLDVVCEVLKGNESLCCARVR